MVRQARHLTTLSKVEGQITMTEIRNNNKIRMLQIQNKSAVELRFYVLVIDISVI